MIDRANNVAGWDTIKLKINSEYDLENVEINITPSQIYTFELTDHQNGGDWDKMGMEDNYNYTFETQEKKRNPLLTYFALLLFIILSVLLILLSYNYYNTFSILGVRHKSIISGILFWMLSIVSIIFFDFISSLMYCIFFSPQNQRRCCFTISMLILSIAAIIFISTSFMVKKNLICAKFFFTPLLVHF